MSTEPTGFLYPFIEAEERDTSVLIADLASSARSKIAESRKLRAATLDQCGDELARVGQRMAERFSRGGRLFAFGNGGSATDAEGIVDLFHDPPRGRPLPGMSLVDDQSVITALANDVGFDLIFSRQVIAHARGRHRRGLLHEWRIDKRVERIRRSAWPWPAHGRARGKRRRSHGDE